MFNGGGKFKILSRLARFNERTAHAAAGAEDCDANGFVWAIFWHGDKTSVDIIGRIIHSISKLWVSTLLLASTCSLGAWRYAYAISYISSRQNVISRRAVLRLGCRNFQEHYRDATMTEQNDIFEWDLGQTPQAAIRDIVQTLKVTSTVRLRLSYTKAALFKSSARKNSVWTHPAGCEPIIKTFTLYQSTGGFLTLIHQLIMR
jgi:hypothetical protein